MKQFTFPLKGSILFHLLFGITFVLSGIMVNIGQTVCYLLVRPLSRAVYSRVTYLCMYTIGSQVVCLADWWAGSDCHVYSKPEDYAKFGTEKALLIMNHSYEIDWLMLWLFTERIGFLGAGKSFVKKMIKYIPAVGWLWTLSDLVFVERNRERDEKIMGEKLGVLLEYSYPIWLLLTAEGTRFTKEKQAASMEVARQKGLPELQHHLLPRTRGFVITLQHLTKDQFPAIYDITLGINRNEGAEPTLKNILLGKKIVGEMYLRRIPLDEVPTEEKDRVQWLHNLYQEKDQILDTYLRTGSFPAGEKFPEGQKHSTKRRLHSLLNFFMWFLIVNSLLMYYLMNMLLKGSVIFLFMGLGVVAFAFLATHKFITLTQISNASTYGNLDKRTQ